MFEVSRSPPQSCALDQPEPLHPPVGSWEGFVALSPVPAVSPLPADTHGRSSLPSCPAGDAGGAAAAGGVQEGEHQHERDGAAAAPRVPLLLTPQDDHPHRAQTLRGTARGRC